MLLLMVRNTVVVVQIRIGVKMDVLVELRKKT
jgi:hypothetical protein